MQTESLVVLAGNHRAIHARTNQQCGEDERFRVETALHDIPLNRDGNEEDKAGRRRTLLFGLASLRPLLVKVAEKNVFASAMAVSLSSLAPTVPVSRGRSDMIARTTGRVGSKQVLDRRQWVSKSL